MDSELKQLGCTTDSLQKGNLEGIYIALWFLDEIESIEIFSEHNGYVVGLSATKDNIMIEDTELLTHHVWANGSLSNFPPVEVGRLYFVTGLSPLTVQNHSYQTTSFGVISKVSVEAAHNVWVKIGLKSQFHINAKERNRLSKLATSLAGNGYKLLKSLCCLDPSCNALNLSRSPHEIEGDLAQKPELITLSEAHLNLVNSFEKLTEFQFATLTLISEGKSNQDTANELFVSLSTIRNTSSLIYNTIGAKNRQHAAAMLATFNSIEPSI